MRLVSMATYSTKRKLNEVYGSKWVYIGRPSPSAHLDGSPLGNPYSTRDHGDKALSLYATWLYKQIRSGNRAILAALKALDEDSILVCWCAPKPCHGEVVMRAWAWWRTQKS